MYSEYLGEMEINISHDLSHRESLRKIKRLRYIILEDFNDNSLLGAIFEKRCEEVKKGA